MKRFGHTNGLSVALKKLQPQLNHFDGLFLVFVHACIWILRDILQPFNYFRFHNLSLHSQYMEFKIRFKKYVGMTFYSRVYAVLRFMKLRMRAT